MPRSFSFRPDIHDPSLVGSISNAQTALLQSGGGLVAYRHLDIYTGGAFSLFLTCMDQMRAVLTYYEDA